MTSLESFKKIIVFAAHPDDETISCGGTIAKLSEMGADICVVFVTDGKTGIDHEKKYENNIIQTRKIESEKACNILGVKKAIYMEYECQDILYSGTLMREILKIIRQEKPDLILTHSQIEKHKDHKVISEAVIQAAWKASENILPNLGKSHLTIDLWAFECVDILESPDFLIDITDVFTKKIKAMKCYLSQDNIIPGIHSYIEGLASTRGFQAGTRYAEAFKRISLLPVVLK